MFELIAAVKAHANDNYEKDGWDYIVEAYTDDELIELLTDAKAKSIKQAIAAAKKEAKMRKAHHEEMYSTEF